MTHPTHPNPPAARADIAVATAKETCNYCRHPIVWARAEEKHDATKMPVDAKPYDDGNVQLWASDIWGVMFSVLGTPGQCAGAREAGWKLYKHHKLSCPDEAKWSRGPKPADELAPRRRARGRGRA